MRRLFGALNRNCDGAVAPTVALSLFALIAAGGLAFDYARLASLDTELQQAADQAALAAVTQLDQAANATTRSVAAAQSLLVNQTLFGNDGGTITVQTGQSFNDSSGNAVARVTFYSTKSDAEAGTNGYPASAAADLTARFVKVDVTGREAVYALTPIVGALRSGTVNASAVAGMGSAICKVPPVMMCNPSEPEGNTNANYPFDGNALAGRGLRLITVGNGPSAWAPGNFGYLDVGSSTSNPNVELREALGWVTAPGDCSALDGVQTRTGAGTPVTQALNTRFDIYEKANVGNGNAASCPSGSYCPPSINTVKDLFQRGTPNAGNKCGIANNEWEIPAEAERYRPNNTTDLTQAAADLVKIMGHPRDKCHAVSINGTCTGGKLGDGNWDRSAYFRVNYGWTSAQWPTYLAMGVASAQITTSTPTRYQVYNWEIANRGASIGGRTILASRAMATGGNPPTDHDGPVCSPLQSPASNGVVPGGSNVDRRRISAAVLNCNAHNVHGGGGTVYPVLKWVEMFLVEPSLNRGDRSDANDVYVEMIGETQLGAGSSAGQVVRRDVPYLVK
jgi:Flp pilus assembly protein TadG